MLEETKLKKTKLAMHPHWLGTSEETKLEKIKLATPPHHPLSPDLPVLKETKLAMPPHLLPYVLELEKTMLEETKLEKVMLEETEREKTKLATPPTTSRRQVRYKRLRVGDERLRSATGFDQAGHTSPADSQRHP